MRQEIEWKIFTFEQLTTGELYDILYLRNEVFVIEQECAYLDTDYKDQKALHICGYAENRLIAYCRVFDAGIYFPEAAIGRVVVDKQYRKYGYGKFLMEKAIETVKNEYKTDTIVISGQSYLLRFYEGLGFKKISEEYMEAGIPHVRMKLN